jgi:CubicO group peptidase (beta-lactamase class C family)/D-alanyl-D-alanine dipeptidase
VRLIGPAILCAVLCSCGRNAPPVEKSSAKYSAVTAPLEKLIQTEMHNQALPAVSIALVDDRQLVWAKGFGLADPKRKIAANENTIYRVGSVSKLFTDTAIMQLVEKGEIDLDAPVSRYLPDFHPTNPFGNSITLRELMSHRSGLVREPPVGHYFDSTAPTLKATVESLNSTTLIYPPGTHTKYSNAAIAVVGYLLQQHVGKPFADYLRDAVLKPLGMSSSSFVPTPEVRAHLADAIIQTYDGRIIQAPTFQLGMQPAGCMYSSVTDLAKFLNMLFAGGNGKNGRVLEAQTLHQMWQPQFQESKERGNFGIGFLLSQLDGHVLVGHGGAIYGFATEVEALPADKLGVVVVTTSDSANAAMTKVANQALRLMLAARAGKPLPEEEPTTALPVSLARIAAARYGAGDDAIDLLEENGTPSVLPAAGGYKIKLRQAGNDLITDDRLAYGQKIELFHDTAKYIGKILPRIEDREPAPAPKNWEGLIGEYGWDYDTLYILEKDGKLTALIEWYEYEPLDLVKGDVYRYPRRGLYDNETFTFKRDNAGRATEVSVGAVVFPRRAVGPADGKIFRIQPNKPVDELRKEALASQPPKESGRFKEPELVELTSLDPTIKLDIRYATTNDFLSTPMYSEARAFMQRPAAEAVVRANQELHKQGYGLLIHDAYRPWYVTKMFWDATPEPDRIFVADPSQGSRHNRGCAVDLTMYETRTGQPVQMVGVYDEMSPRSYPFYPGGTARQRWLRAVLRHAMEEQRFTVYETEWWHFDYYDWQSYPILNQTFEQLDAQNSIRNHDR